MVDRLCIPDAILALHPRQIRAPEAAAGAERRNQPLHVPVQVVVRERPGGKARQVRQLHADVRQGGEGGRGLNIRRHRVVRRVPADAKVIDRQPQPRVPCRDRSQLRLRVRDQQHGRQVVLLGKRPVPVGGAVLDPVALPLERKRQPDALHPRMPGPRPHQRPRIVRPIERNAPHDAEAVGMALARLQRHVHPIIVPCRRHQQRTVHPGSVHQRQQHAGVQFRHVAHVAQALVPPGDPRPLGRLGAPDMHLRVDDKHRAVPFRPGQRRSRRPPGCSGRK